MAGGQERALKRRIKSVQGTKKITRAMELIAASRIVKAQGRLAAARPYADKITEVLRNLQNAGASASHPLLRTVEEVRSVGYIVVTADRGLAGGYNASVIRMAELAMKRDIAAGRNVTLIVTGRKGVNTFTYRGTPIAAKFTGFSETPSYENARNVANAAMELYEKGELDQVNVVYTQFLSFGTQRAVIKRFAPLEDESIGAELNSLRMDSDVASEMTGGSSHHSVAPVTTEAAPKADYEYEPSPSEILNRLVPRYVESRLYAVLLDAAASEQAARQRAMKSATDNAEELAKILTRSMNRARQDAITQEIMEIVGGAEALVSDDPEQLFGEDLGLVEDDRHRLAMITNQNVLH